MRATRHHASNLARFATIYKLTTLALKYWGPTPGKEGRFPKRNTTQGRPRDANPCLSVSPHTGPYDSFFAGLLGGYVVFGGRSKRSGRISSINQQIVIYIFARVVLALARLAIKPGFGVSVLSAEPLRARVAYHAWPAFASLSWGMVMLLFKYHPEDLQPSLRSSMTYIYQDCDSWDSLRTLIWHNK